MDDIRRKGLEQGVAYMETLILMNTFLYGIIEDSIRINGDDIEKMQKEAFAKRALKIQQIMPCVEDLEKMFGRKEK